MKFWSEIENPPKIQFQDPKIINIYGTKIVSCPVPRYLLVSQSSIPALQAMWKFACEGTPTTFGPLEAQISAKLPQNIFKWKSTLLNETSYTHVKPRCSSHRGLNFDQMKALRLQTSVRHVGWLQTTRNGAAGQKTAKKCELHFSSRNVRLTWYRMETWKLISVGAHTL